MLKVALVTAGLVGLLATIIATPALAATEPASSEYPFSLEQAAEKAQADWLESMLGSAEELEGEVVL